MQVQSRGQEDILVEGIAIHFSNSVLMGLVGYSP